MKPTVKNRSGEVHAGRAMGQPGCDPWRHFCLCRNGARRPHQTLDSRARFLNINTTGVLVRSWCSLGGHLAMSSDIFGCHTWRCYWHPVGTDRHCCYISCNARTAPTTKNYRTQNVNSVGVEKPAPGRGERGPTCTQQAYTTRRGRAEIQGGMSLKLSGFSMWSYSGRPIRGFTFCDLRQLQSRSRGPSC